MEKTIEQLLNAIPHYIISKIPQIGGMEFWIKKGGYYWSAGYMQCGGYLVSFDYPDLKSALTALYNWLVSNDYITGEE